MKAFATFLLNCLKVAGYTLAVVAVLAALMVLMEWPTYSHTPSYAGMEDRAGFFARGWVPEWALAPAATDIEESHDIDTNEVFLAYRFAGPFPAPDVCKPVSRAEAGVPEPGKRRFLFFPRFVKQMVRTLRNDPALAFYTCPGARADHSVLAIDERGGRAYYWSGA